MGISFSSSLFGLAGSLMLGFLDLQIEPGAEPLLYRSGRLARLHRARIWPAKARGVSAASCSARSSGCARRSEDGASGSRGTTAAMANLAEAIQGLVAHMRTEQQMIREWADGQGEQNREIKKLLERIATPAREELTLRLDTSPSASATSDGRSSSMIGRCAARMPRLPLPSGGWSRS